MQIYEKSIINSQSELGIIPIQIISAQSYKLSHAVPPPPLGLATLGEGDRTDLHSKVYSPQTLSSKPQAQPLIPILPAPSGCSIRRNNQIVKQGIICFILDDNR